MYGHNYVIRNVSLRVVNCVQTILGWDIVNGELCVSHSSEQCV